MTACIFDGDVGGPMVRCTDIAGRVLWLVPGHISAVEELRAPGGDGPARCRVTVHGVGYTLRTSAQEVLRAVA